MFPPQFQTSPYNDLSKVHNRISVLTVSAILQVFSLPPSSEYIFVYCIYKVSRLTASDILAQGTKQLQQKHWHAAVSLNGGRQRSRLLPARYECIKRTTSRKRIHEVLENGTTSETKLFPLSLTPQQSCLTCFKIQQISFSKSLTPFPWVYWLLFSLSNILADLRAVLLIHLIVTNNGSISPVNYLTSSQMHAFSAHLLRRDPVPTQAKGRGRGRAEKDVFSFLPFSPISFKGPSKTYMGRTTGGHCDSKGE